MRKITVNQNDAGQRLDKFLEKYLVGMPKGLLYKAFRKKRIKVNGKKGEISRRLEAGDVLELYLNDEFFRQEQLAVPAWLTQPAALRIVYEDAQLLIADKPSGLPAHAESGKDSLLARIQAFLYQKGEYRPLEEHTFAPALCHRIDRNTSGLVIAAKTAEALRTMNEKIRLREVEKFYLCRTEGVPQPESGMMENYLRKNFQTNTVQVFDTPRENSVLARTGYRVLKKEGGFALVEAELFTGRTHQIRAQFAHAGCPLAGDVKYGARKNGGQKFQQLRSWRLRFAFRTPAGCLEYLNGMEFTAQGVDW